MEKLPDHDEILDKAALAISTFLMALNKEQRISLIKDIDLIILDRLLKVSMVRENFEVCQDIKDEIMKR